MKTTDKDREKDYFSQIVRNKLANYSLPIEEGSWEEFEKRMNDPSRKKVPLWTWFAGISIAASIVWAILFSFHPRKLYYDNTTQLSNYTELPVRDLFAEEKLPSNRPTSVRQTQAVPQHSEKDETPVSEFVVHEPDMEVMVEQTALTNTEPIVTKEKNRKEQPPSNPSRRKFKKRSGSFGLHISSGGGSYASNNTLNSANVDYSIPARSPKFEVNAPASLSKDILSPDDFGKISHRPPVSVGLSIQKTLTDYLSVESGLTYTYLYSIFENKVPQQNANLALHYLGIPVNLVIDFLPYSRSSWNFYFSAGGMIEKGLLAHYVQSTYTPSNDVLVHTDISNETIDGLQWSVQAALGVSYRFSQSYSLFIEPKINYYLNNNQPFNVRAEHPFVPGINIGLRHTW
jgi:hypothetical protein